MRIVAAFIVAVTFLQLSNAQQTRTFNRPDATPNEAVDKRQTIWPDELIYDPNDPANASLSGLPLAARREVVRRQSNITEARNAVTRGDTARYIDGDLETAVSEYRKGFDLLPEAPMTAEVRQDVGKKYAGTSVALAESRIEEGRYTEAISMLEAVLAPAVMPDHAGAKSLLAKLNDPLYFNPALTPEHKARVEQVEAALNKAMGYYNLGDFDAAETEYNRVLNIDKYNSGARRGMEISDRAKTKYFDSAYDETRARYLRQIMEGWETSVEEVGLEGSIGGGPRTGPGVGDGVAYNKAKLKAIIIPRIEFTDTPLEDAVEFLRQKSVELDTMEPDPSRKGLNIIIQEPSAAPAGAAPAVDEFGFAGAAPAAPVASVGGASPRITLMLSNIPLMEALRYTTEQAQRKVKVEAFAVKIVPLSDIGDELFTKVYRVPPSFLNLGGGGGGGGGAPEDPFAAPAAAEGASQLTAKPTALAVLEEKGIAFPSGSSAFFNPSTSQLVVRNTQNNMELVDSFVDSIQEEVQKQLTITTRFVEVQQNNREELGIDWLLGVLNGPGNPFNIGTGVNVGGGTTGNVRPAGVTTGSANSDFPVGTGTPVSGGLRSGAAAIGSSSIDGAIANSSQVGGGVLGTFGSAAAPQQLAPAIFGITGFGSPSFEVVLRGLSQRKGVDVVTAPSITARSGQRAQIEVIREFIYPTEYDPPDIPNNIGSQGAGSVFPVTPANPTAFETRSVGTTLEVDPIIGADGYTIDLTLAPEVVEFDGFLNYGSPITTTLPGSGSLPAIFFSALGALTLNPGTPMTPNSLAQGVPALPGVFPLGGPIPATQARQATLTDNRIVMPVFSARRANTSVTVWDGQTVIIGGLIREDVQSVRDSIPILGDIPIFGKLFRSRADQTLKRNLNILVTPKLIDPAGQPIRDFDALAGSTPEDVQ